MKHGTPLARLIKSAIENLQCGHIYFDAARAAAGGAL